MKFLVVNVITCEGEALYWSVWRPFGKWTVFLAGDTNIFRFQKSRQRILLLFPRIRTTFDIQIITEARKITFTPSPIVESHLISCRRVSRSTPLTLSTYKRTQRTRGLHEPENCEKSRANQSRQTRQMQTCRI